MDSPLIEEGWGQHHLGVFLFGAFSLVVVQIIDLLAVRNAHRMFYRSGRSAGKQSFANCPTKVDATISMLYCGGAVFLVKSGLFSSSPDLMDRFPGASTKQHLVASALFTAAAAVNVAMSLPSLSMLVPSAMARAQGFASLSFFAGSLLQLFGPAMQLSLSLTDQEMVSLRGLSSLCAVVSYAVVWIGCITNCFRVNSLLTNVHNWGDADRRDGDQKSNRGILSWFKASRSDGGLDGTDYDSDYIDEEDGSSGDERYERKSHGNGFGCRTWVRR